MTTYLDDTWLLGQQEDLRAIREKLQEAAALLARADTSLPALTRQLQVMESREAAFAKALTRQLKDGQQRLEIQEQEARQRLDDHLHLAIQNLDGTSHAGTVLALQGDVQRLLGWRTAADESLQALQRLVQTEAAAQRALQQQGEHLTEELADAQEGLGALRSAHDARLQTLSQTVTPLPAALAQLQLVHTRLVDDLQAVGQGAATFQARAEQAMGEQQKKIKLLEGYQQKQGQTIQASVQATASVENQLSRLAADHADQQRTLTETLDAVRAVAADLERVDDLQGVLTGRLDQNAAEVSSLAQTQGTQQQQLDRLMRTLSAVQDASARRDQTVERLEQCQTELGAWRQVTENAVGALTLGVQAAQRQGGHLEQQVAGVQATAQQRERAAAAQLSGLADHVAGQITALSADLAQTGAGLAHLTAQGTAHTAALADLGNRLQSTGQQLGQLGQQSTDRYASVQRRERAMNAQLSSLTDRVAAQTDRLNGERDRVTALFEQQESAFGGQLQGHADQLRDAQLQLQGVGTRLSRFLGWFMGAGAVQRLRGRPE